MSNKKNKATSKQGQKQIPAKIVSTHQSNRLLTLLIFAFAFLLYANTLNHGYVLDDDVVFLKNKDVQRGTAGIRDILHHSFIYGFTGHNDQSYRPVVLIIFAIEKQIFGNNPHAGHLINVLLFALSCVLLYYLLQQLFIQYKLSVFSVFNIQVSFPFVITLLFAVHPIHTEAVANIKGRDDILDFIFLELLLYSILKYIDGGRIKNFIWSNIFFFLALLSKEVAVTFLAIIPLTLFFFREVRIKKIAVYTMTFFGVFILYMIIRSSILDTVTFNEKMEVVNNALAAATNTSDRIATALYILGKYVILLFIPYPLSWDYSYNQIPIVGFADWKVMITLLLLLTLIGYALAAFVRQYKSSLINSNRRGSAPTTSQIISYCILFFFITMSVVSNIFILIGSTLGERFLFIPSLAFCIAVPFILQQIGRNGLAIGTASIILLFSFKTIARNRDWKDNFSLFTSGAIASPNSSRAQSALGTAYREAAEKEIDPVIRGEEYNKAIASYRIAIKILPDNVEALYNLGVCYYALGLRDSALKIYDLALNISPEYANAANNAGVIYFERGNYEIAKKYFLQAVQYFPNQSDALGNLGAIMHNQGKLKEAIGYYEKALQINPSNQNIASNQAKAKEALAKSVTANEKQVVFDKNDLE